MRTIRTMAALAGIAALVVLPAIAGEDGAALYKGKCAMCHSDNGVAKPMAKGSANLNDPAFQKANTPASIEAVIADGKGKMKGFKDKLTPEQIKAIAAHVMTLK